MKLLNDEDLSERGIEPRSKPQRWRLIKAGKFPKPIKIGKRNLWPESEIDAFIKSRMAERDGVETP